MRGKIGLVIGVGIGYVLGTRAGRERYDQIKAQAMKVWNLDPVQQQVSKVSDFAKSSAMAIPGALWDGAVKVSKAAGRQGSPGQKLDAALKAGKNSADDVKKAADVTIDEVKKITDDAIDDVTKTTAKAAPKATTKAAPKATTKAAPKSPPKRGA